MIKTAMERTLGAGAEGALKALMKGHPAGRGEEGAGDRGDEGPVHDLALVDALTRLAREQANAGERTDADEKASALLALAA